MDSTGDSQFYINHGKAGNRKKTYFKATSLQERDAWVRAL